MNPGTEDSLEHFPLLDEARSLNALHVPDSYFKTLSGRVMESVHAASTTEDDISLPQTATPQQTPEGYFDTLPANITEKINSRHARKIQTGPLFKWARLAAAAALLVCAGYGIYRIAQPGALDNVTVAQLSAADVQAYETEYAEDVAVTETGAEASLLAHVQPDDAALWLGESAAGDDGSVTE